MTERERERTNGWDSERQRGREGRNTVSAVSCFLCKSSPNEFVPKGGGGRSAVLNRFSRVFPGQVELLYGPFSTVLVAFISAAAKRLKAATTSMVEGKRLRWPRALLYTNTLSRAIAAEMFNVSNCLRIIFTRSARSRTLDSCFRFMLIRARDPPYRASDRFNRTVIGHACKYEPRPKIVAPISWDNLHYFWVWITESS